MWVPSAFNTSLFVRGLPCPWSSSPRLFLSSSWPSKPLFGTGSSARDIHLFNDFWRNSANAYRRPSARYPHRGRCRQLFCIWPHIARRPAFRSSRRDWLYSERRRVCGFAHRLPGCRPSDGSRQLARPPTASARHMRHDHRAPLRSARNEDPSTPRGCGSGAAGGDGNGQPRRCACGIHAVRDSLRITHSSATGVPRQPLASQGQGEHVRQPNATQQLFGGERAGKCPVFSYGPCS